MIRTSCFIARFQNLLRATTRRAKTRNSYRYFVCLSVCHNAVLIQIWIKCKLRLFTRISEFFVRKFLCRWAKWFLLNVKIIKVRPTKLLYYCC